MLPIITPSDAEDGYLLSVKVEIKFWTHKVDGLTENNFIMATKIGQLT